MAHKPQHVFSSSNSDKTQKLRNQLETDVDFQEDDGPIRLIQFSRYNVSLEYDMDDVRMVERYRNLVVDTDMSRELNQGKIINICLRLRCRLEPLLTTGDGNCLMHAVSLAMWGIDDEQLFLRRLVFVSLKNHAHLYRKRWEEEHRLLNEALPELHSMGFSNEWELILNQSNLETRDHNLTYDHLQGIHIFVLSNILRRPIIVISDPVIRNASGAPLQQNVIFGVYLPLLWKPDECVTKTPIVLAFHVNHFSPLVVVDFGGNSTNTDGGEKRYNAVPLFDNNLKIFPIRFTTDEEKINSETCLRRYMKIHDIIYKHRDPTKTRTVMAANLTGDNVPIEWNVIDDHIQQFRRGFVSELSESSSVAGEFDNRLTSSNDNIKYGICETMGHIEPDITTETETKPGDETETVAETETVCETVAETKDAQYTEIKPKESHIMRCLKQNCERPAHHLQTGLCIECCTKERSATSIEIDNESMKSVDFWYDDFEMVPNKYDLGLTSHGSYVIDVDPIHNTTETCKVLTKKCKTIKCFTKVDENAGAFCERCLAADLANRELEMKQIQAANNKKSAISPIVRKIATRLPEGYLIYSDSVPFGTNRDTQKRATAGRDFEHENFTVYQTNMEGQSSSATGAHNFENEPLSVHGNNIEGQGHGKRIQNMEVGGDSDVVTCLNPHCDKVMTPPDRICVECLQVWDLNDKKQAPANVVRCLSKKCPFYGSSEFQGFCSQCFKTKTQNKEKKQSKINPKTSVPSPYLNISPHHIKRGKPCINRECTRFGDVNMDDLCTRCFDIRMRPIPGDITRGSANYYGRRNSPRNETNSNGQGIQNRYIGDRTFYRDMDITENRAGKYRDMGLTSNRSSATKVNSDTVCIWCHHDFDRKLVNRMCDLCYGNVYGYDVAD